MARQSARFDARYPDGHPKPGTTASGLDGRCRDRPALSEPAAERLLLLTRRTDAAPRVRGTAGHPRKQPEVDVHRSPRCYMGRQARPPPGSLLRSSRFAGPGRRARQKQAYTSGGGRRLPAGSARWSRRFDACRPHRLGAAPTHVRSRRTCNPTTMIFTPRS
jgi:hypothetical protein